MKLSHRAYPYPVVGNADDVLDAAFQASIDVQRDGVNYYFNITITCSSKTINKLVARGDASFVFHVECSNTLYREAIHFAEFKKEVMIPGDALNATVEVNVFAVSKREIKNYRVDNSHEDYGDNSFRINRGDVLAIAETHSFDVDITFDDLREVNSIMQIEQKDDGADSLMDVSFLGDKITINLSKQDFENYKIIRGNKLLSASLICTLVLPALVDAIDLIKEKDTDAEGTRWHRCISRRIADLNLSLDHSSLELAQRLLELPIRRAFASARKFIQDGDE